MSIKLLKMNIFYLNIKLIMSIKTNIDNLSWEIRQKINTDLKIEMKGQGMSRYIFPFTVVNDDIYIPFAFAVSETHLKRPLRVDFPSISVKFEGVLRDEQLIIKKEALDILSDKGSVIISAYVGCGKTIMSICIACRIKLKTLIIVNKVVLIDQWKESILKFCPTAKIQKLTSKSKFDDDCDFYIMNAINIPKMGSKFFAKIGTVLVDELHLIMAEGLSKSLQCVSPRYLIGLSATPYREDGLDGLISFFFGNDKIIRKLYRNHTVYRVYTGIKIDMEINDNTGRINWGKILQTQSDDDVRNNLIVKIIQHFKDRTFLILCKRVEQANILVKKLQDVGEYVDNLIGSKQEYDKDARILVGIHQKISTGFDHPKLDALLLATDLEAFFIQSLGRVFRVQNSVPLVFDIIDDNPILLKHYKSRKEVYIESGGKIIDFYKAFPGF